MKQVALPDSSHTSSSSAPLPSWREPWGPMQCSRCNDLFSSPRRKLAVLNTSFSVEVCKQMSGWFCSKDSDLFISLWDITRSMEICCDHLEEVKFICRPQLSKVSGWEGVNYNSSEAKFTCFWHLPTVFEIFEDVTSILEKAASWERQTYSYLYPFGKQKTLPRIGILCYNLVSRKCQRKYLYLTLSALGDC